MNLEKKKKIREKNCTLLQYRMCSIAKFLATKNNPSCVSFFESYTAKEPKLYKRLRYACLT